IVETAYSLTCGCGLCGHWEAYASGRNMPAFFQAWCRREELCQEGFDVRTAESIFEAARRGDRVASSFLEEVGKINGRGVSNVIVAYNPEAIVLDGAVVQNNPDLILSPMERHIDRYLRVPDIRVSPLGGEAPLLGAAAFAAMDEDE
ncbi:MAG TPA: ROK family protein, partial [Methanomicrobiales archaeon]|nr:ROK family protein [Methanomicrobiales archaeon]